MAMTVKVDEDILKAVNESVITTANRVQSGMKTNKVAAETENTTKSTPASKSSTAAETQNTTKSTPASKPSAMSGVTKPRASAFDVMQVRMYTKLQRMGKLMFIAGSCTIFIVILLGLTVIKIDYTSVFMWTFIYLGSHICFQISNIVQVAAIRISIRKSSD